MGTNCRRIYQSPLRVQPAYQRFHPGDLPCLKIEYRLVVQHKLVPPQRAAQIRFQRLPFSESRVHLVAEELIVIPAVLLGFVHRVIRSIHQAFRVLPVDWGKVLTPMLTLISRLLLSIICGAVNALRIFRALYGGVFGMLDLGEEYHEFVPA